MRKNNDKRRNNEKTHYHKNPTKIAANPGLFPCQIVVEMYNVAQSIHKSPTFTNQEENT